MHFSPAIIAFFIASMAPTASAGLSAEDMEEAVGDGCINTIKFHSSFKTDAGDTCSTCNFCEGSRLSSLFNPNIENVCIECGTADNSCNALEVVTDFENPWLMDFIELSSSTMGSENDPFKIVINASDDSKTWTTIYDSEVVFAERNEEQLVVLNNNKQYEMYSILFQRKSGSASMYLGQYRLVESYTKGCASNIYGGATGDNVLPYETLAPTESPTIEPPAGHVFTDNDSLQTAADLWISNKQEALQEYGEIKYWNTGEVTLMKDLFKNRYSFDEDLSLWDTSKVIDMNYMFHYANAFNADLSNWNTSKVGSMLQMFFNANSFNSDISKWDISGCNNMYAMFRLTSAFNQDLCWDMTGVSDTRDIFKDSPGSTDCV